MNVPKGAGAVNDFWRVVPPLPREPQDTPYFRPWEAGFEAGRHPPARTEIPGPDWRDVVLPSLREGWETGDIVALARLLHRDVNAITDGGGQASAPQRPVRGIRDVTQLLLAIKSEHPGMTVAQRSVNGRHGLLLREGDRAIGVAIVNIHGGWLTDLWIVLNPEKLRGWHGR